MDYLFKKDRVIEFETMLCDRNDDDWFVPDYSLEWIEINEYRMYELECNEVLMEDAEEVC